MHCPNCGSSAPNEQKFCRSCGFDLKPISQLVGGTAEVLADDKWRRTLTKWVVIVFSVFVVASLTLFFLPPTNGDGGRGLSSPELAISLMALAMIFAVPAAILLLAIWWPKLVRRSPLQPSKLTEQWPQAEIGKTTNKMLVEPSLEAAASITENTTRQLEETKR